MTIKLQRLAEVLPECSTMKEAGERAGFVKGSRQIYRKSTKKYLAEYLRSRGVTKDTLQDYFAGLAELAIKTGDLSNAERSGENIAKMAGFMKESNVQGVAVNINGVIDTLKGSGQAVDKVVDSNILQDNNIEQPKFT